MEGSQRVIILDCKRHKGLSGIVREQYRARRSKVLLDNGELCVDSKFKQIYD